MCRCWQRCWEDFYWNCIEEKFCYDETIANYNPEEDEYYEKKNGNGFLTPTKLDNNNTPVCVQPSSIIHQRQSSCISNSKIHEEDYRQIATNAPILAPEILSVFANSQIFHDHQPLKTKNSFPAIHSPASKIALGNREADSDKLLFRLEGGDPINDPTSIIAANPSLRTTNVTFSIESPSSGSDASIEQLPTRGSTAAIAAADGSGGIGSVPIIREQDDKGEVILRPKIPGIGIGIRNVNTKSSINPSGSGGDNSNSSFNNSTPILNKRLVNVQSVPYFPFRPASENDIFSITVGSGGGSLGQISMTPEIPSISFNRLPSYYEDTPTIEKYKEMVSLYDIQTANTARIAEYDRSMPRSYFRPHSVAQSVDNLSPMSGTGIGGSGLIKSSGISTSTKNVEKSKRLKLLRTNLPPLAIHLSGVSRERNKDKGIE